jgi:hypothetical protein
MNTKTCKDCQKNKPTSEFYLTGRNHTPSGRCKVCERKLKHDRRLANLDYCRARDRKAAARWRLSHPYSTDAEKLYYKNYHRKAHLRINYGLTYDDFLAMIEKQDGICPICKQAPSEHKWGRKWNVDHDHATGKVRGLLCRKCNLALGHFDDSIERMQAAIDYLSAFSTPQLNAR